MSKQINRNVPIVVYCPHQENFKNISFLENIWEANKIFIKLQFVSVARETFMNLIYEICWNNKNTVVQWKYKEFDGSRTEIMALNFLKYSSSLWDHNLL
jgi:hypothetical protein